MVRTEDSGGYSCFNKTWGELGGGRRIGKSARGGPTQNTGRPNFDLQSDINDYIMFLFIVMF